MRLALVLVMRVVSTRSVWYLVPARGDGALWRQDAMPWKFMSLIPCTVPGAWSLWPRGCRKSIWGSLCYIVVDINVNPDKYAGHEHKLSLFVGLGPDADKCKWWLWPELLRAMLFGMESVLTRPLRRLWRCYWPFVCSKRQRNENAEWPNARPIALWRYHTVGIKGRILICNVYNNDTSLFRLK